MKEYWQLHYKQLILAFLLFVFVLVFLNQADLFRIIEAIVNTSLAILFSITFSFLFAIQLLFLSERFKGIELSLKIIKALPQIIWLILFYSLINQNILTNNWSSIWITMVCSFFFAIVLLPDLYAFLESILANSKERGIFYPLRSLGVSLKRTLLQEVLWRENKEQVLLKICSLLAYVFFLQISIEFIISVGLSETIGVINFPISLGQLLVQVGSKQDLLAVGYTLTNPSYISELLSQHLFGISVALTIVLTMLASFKLSNFATRLLNEN